MDNIDNMPFTVYNLLNDLTAFYENAQKLDIQNFSRNDAGTLSETVEQMEKYFGL